MRQIDWSVNEFVLGRIQDVSTKLTIATTMNEVGLESCDEGHFLIFIITHRLIVFIFFYMKLQNVLN